MSRIFFFFSTFIIPQPLHCSTKSSNKGWRDAVVSGLTRLMLALMHLGSTTSRIGGISIGGGASVAPMVVRTRKASTLNSANKKPVVQGAGVKKNEGMAILNRLAVDTLTTIFQVSLRPFMSKLK